jgi:hypothetical protein
MFETVDEQIETTEGGPVTTRTRLIRLAEIVVIVGMLFAGLYFAIVSFE